MISDRDHIAKVHELAVDFFRGIYGESAIVPQEKLYNLPAYPCWALACHAYEVLLGIDPRSLQRDKTAQLPAEFVNGAWAWAERRLDAGMNRPWQDAVIENARRIGRECQ